MNASLRVIFEDETDPSFPDSWGWEQAETDEYMGKIDSGEYVVLAAHVEHRCADCGDWHGMLASLGDIHASWDDLCPQDRNGALRTVTDQDIPYGPSWWGPERVTPANAATALTSSSNYLLHVAADLLAEARAEL